MKNDESVVIEITTPQEMLILSSLIGVIGKDKFIDTKLEDGKGKYLQYAGDNSIKFKVSNKVAVQFIAYFGQWLSEQAAKALDDENS